MIHAEFRTLNVSPVFFAELRTTNAELRTKNVLPFPLHLAALLFLSPFTLSLAPCSFNLLPCAFLFPCLFSERRTQNHERGTFSLSPPTSYLLPFPSYLSPFPFLPPCLFSERRTQNHERGTFSLSPCVFLVPRQSTAVVHRPSAFTMPLLSLSVVIQHVYSSAIP